MDHKRNSDCISNYVDRVRICDTKSNDSESIYSKASSQKSGWRQKSLSNIDLSLSSKEYQPGAGAFRYRDFEAHDDLCIKNLKNNKNIEIQRDYEDICNVNPKAQGQKRDIIQEHNKVHVNNKRQEGDVCSLRRSKSLAVIREETYNELAITGTKTRRSQLIPRAKLIDRNFFKDRLSFPLDEAFSLSLDSTIDNDSKKSNSHCYSWQCDRSDLGSIDSSIFKHSLHQGSLEKSNTLRTDSTKIVSRAEIHRDGALNNDNESVVREQKDASNTININEDTESGITIIEIKDRKQHGSGPTSSVISYDSIYLSSESDRQTVLGDTTESLGDIDAKIKDFEEIIKELNVVGDNGKAELIIDNLYSRVGKGKSKEDEEEALTTVGAKLSANNVLGKYNDYISRGTLERLTVLTGRIEQDKLDRSEEDKKRGGSVTDFQYSSLPDAGISKLLRDSELIDARLRDDVSVELLEPYPDYDSLPNDANEGRVESSSSGIKSNEALDAKRFVGVKNSAEPISLEENPKGASIELIQLSTREIIDKDTSEASSYELIKSNTTKVYLPEIGVEFDYENSIASFESDLDFESPPPALCTPPIFNLVTISGRKVIVDELAAKVEQKVDSKKLIGVQPTATATAATVIVSEKKAKDIPEAKEIVKKANSEDKNKPRSDRKEKIKVSDCKQQTFDSSDKKLLFQLKTSNKPETSTEKSAAQSETNCSSHRLLRRNCLSFNMPRPQLLSIIDSKNSVPKKDLRVSKPEARVDSDKEEAMNPTELEFLHKVDSVRSYWSKMVDEGHRDGVGTLKKNFLASKSSNDIPEALKNEDFQSFFPTVEIVELNGETQAALVTSRKLNDVEFDHVRYKVMKSDMFQKNMLVSNRKETQFDGLMQYLQDYSFQELLANNNVVIIEPVRTKIEKVEEKPNKAQSAACKITNGAHHRNGSNNLKKHFFYQPIRVNKELYEEELPVPDTVRNVRKLFEGSLKRGALSKVVVDDSKHCESSDNSQRKIRYLTIDTSFDNNNLAVSKWDSISLSSGVSSAADLNSPCECQDGSNKDIKFVCSSKENLDNEADDNDDEGEFKSHFVSADVLEKIRECGSSITYYGGQALGERKINTDAMTKAIMREISNQKCNCQTRRSRQTGANEKNIRKLSNDYSGLQFKLVKSNSCSSRLELTGTCLEMKSNFDAVEEMRNIIHNNPRDASPGADKSALSEQEESVKEMVNRLESKNVAPSKPRIIESKCIEKVVGKEAPPKLTINHQSFERAKTAPNEPVTVNNHISVTTSGPNNPQDEDTLKPKVVRNKNVDLAMASVTRRHENLKHTKASSGDTENLAQKETPELSSKWSNICKMDSVEMVKNQDKINNSAHIKSIESPSSKPSAADDKHIKMVNWSTVGSPLGKAYIANDRSLIQQKVYDEMEFEEFEVLGEHYDSLNSK